MIVFIDTHGRPDKQFTYETLRSQGYTGKIVFVVDDEDITVDRLHENYPDDEIKMFHKQDYYEKVDSGVNNSKRELNLFARCACENIAKSFGCETFVMADDDITGFRYRYREDGHLRSLRLTKNLDTVFDDISSYMLDSNIAAVSPGIPQMYFTGDIESNLWKWRVPYTFVFRNANYSMNWVAEYEEDIITAINSANNGDYLTVLPIIQRETVIMGSNDGGMHKSYADSFRNAQFGYIWHPSCEEITEYKGKYMCKIKRGNAFPRLISSSYKKK